MKTLFTLVIALLSGITMAQSPYTNIQISNQNGPNEVSICINPKNINQLVGGANINSYYYSTNGGSNWTRGSLTSSSYGVWGDPCVIVDTNQHFYYFHLSNPPSGGSWIDRIVCQKSTNAGVNWNNPGTYMGLNPPKDQDKEWGIVDWTGGPRGNWIYVTWTEFDVYGSSSGADSSRILFSRSTDGGATWLAPVRLSQRGGNCVDEDYTTEGAVPAVGPNGEVYVAWSGPLGVNDFRIFFDKSTDGGNTWLANDVIAAPQPGGWDYNISGIQRCNGLPITLCDISNGPYRGTIYINWTDEAGAGDHDVKVCKSTNGGLNWSAPIRVNNDAPGKEQFFTWMTIDKATGFLYCVFYDRRNYTDNQTDVFLARSTDGGNTWLNERISTTPFTPTSSVFFGDYNGITAHNGRVRPIWTRLQSGSLSVWTALIDFPIGINPVSNEIPSSYSLEQNYPNPFNPTTNVKFQLPNHTFVKLTVFDALGRVAAVLVNEQLNPGSYNYQWDATDLPSGVYFYTLEAGEFSGTKKMILIK
ncbi:MAG: T9SS type A sorting domain-containing protein [Chlorobi bacterium]|nr:T9SS type A sorting domain-containing protein [Chlorobiota bacterium]MCI0715733.1 T9SS type A sorting domain-containing protein [Chlorobiota bacterium]